MASRHLLCVPRGSQPSERYNCNTDDLGGHHVEEEAGEVLKPHRVAENHAADDHAQALAQGGLQDLLLSYHCGAREQWVSLDRVGERVRVAHRGTPE